jgi:serine/threonine protein kinase
MIGQRYRLLDELGSGGMGAVYRAQDRLTRQFLALKQVHAEEYLDAGGSDEGSDVVRLNLAQEFRVLAGLPHPHVIQVLDYGFDEKQCPYYTMELLENAQTILDAGEPSPFSTKIELLMQLLQALAYLHHRSVIHGDLKPSNVLVAGRGVKVLDFGLSMLGGQSNDTISTTAGTLPYMAPEVLAGAPPTAAADLYAVGVITFELLIGRHPFNRNDLSRLIHQVLYSPLDLSGSQLQPGMLLFLEQILAKDPNLRYPGAHEALSALSEAAQCPLPLETIEIRESFLQTAPLVGREHELNTLTNALTAAIGGSGSAWLIGGESGVGKSRLLEELRIRAMVHGAVVVRGRGDDQHSGSYSLWRPLVRWLCLLTQLEEDEASVLRAAVPDIADLLGEGQTGEEYPSQRQLEQVMERLLARIQHPVMLILEDLHWAGSESLNLLNRISQFQ